MRYKATSPFARGDSSSRRETPRRRPPQRDALRDWAATLPILLLLALLLVGDPARASVPSLTYAGVATPGARITVSGAGFVAAGQYQLRWDGDTRGMPKVKALPDGTFATALRVPPQAAAGMHEVQAVAARGGNRAPTGVLASVMVTVVAPPAAATPTPVPTAPPTPAPTRTASPAATPSPTPHHHPTPAPTPVAPAPPSATPMPSHHGGADPVACTGYPEPRVFLESQGWWTQTPGKSGTDFGHVHVGMCFPQAQRVRGVVTLDVRLTMHHNPGTLTRLYGGIETGGGGFDLWNTPVGLSCPHSTCVVWTQLRVDTARVPVDGRVEWRFRPQVRTPDGKDFTPSTGWQTYLANGSRPVSDYRSRDEATGRGWYDGTGYANASIMSVPLGPISGSWSANVILDRGSDGIPVTSHGIYIDPDFHHGSKGLVIREGSGPYRGAVTINAASLSPGVHRLVLRSNAADVSGSTNSGLLVVFFTVSR